jgi:hypothetical protein
MYPVEKVCPKYEPNRFTVRQKNALQNPRLKKFNPREKFCYYADILIQNTYQC